VTIENCSFTGFGIAYPGFTFTANPRAGVHVTTFARVSITGSTFSNNDAGVHVDSNASNVRVSHSKFYGHSMAGILVSPSLNSTSATANVSDSVMLNNYIGLYAYTGFATGAATASFTADHVTADGNDFGIIVANAGATGVVSNSHALGNGSNINAEGFGVLNSANNNISTGGTVTNAAATLVR
jgi:hypothetical protein